MEDASDKELEQRLEEAGNELLNPPSSVDELRTLLDRLHDCLSKVEQSPPISMQNALSASKKALVAENLLKHPDEDLKVAVAASISEITRITAPDAPYEDEQMKAVFQLIVSSFEKLADMSNRSYAKRISILETVAKVRSCVVMLDLECDALITEMFQHFLKAIRESHPDNIFSSMETIMTLVIEESEDISSELLSTILDHVKKDNKEVLPISRKLAEGVLQTCASKLKPYLIEIVKSSGISVDNYSNVVSSICQGTSDSKEQNEIDSNKLEKEKSTEVVTPERVDVPNEGSVKSVVSNGVAQTGESHSMADSDSSKKQDGGCNVDAPKKSDKLSEADHVKAANEKERDTADKKKPTTGKRKKPIAAKRTKSSKLSNGDEMESKSLAESIVGGKDLLSSPQDDPSASAAKASENEMEVDDGVLPNKQVEAEPVIVDLPPGWVKIPDKKHPKKAGNQKKKNSLPKEAETTTNDSPIEASKAPEAKTTKKSGKKVASRFSNKKKRTVGSTKKGSSVASKSKATPVKPEKEDEDSDVMEESSKQEDREGRAKANSDRDELRTSSKDSDKEMIASPKSATKSGKDDQHMEETPKENSKRKRSLGKEKASGSKECGENLVGSRIKVYWPMDRSYYVGVVDSYDAAKKRHLVLYDDGDQEILYLKNQKWEFIQDDPESTEKEAAEKKTPGSNPESQRKKAKTGSGVKPGKTTVSAKKAGGASTSKSKPLAAKSSATKSGKTETKSKEASKALAKMETDSDDGDAATDDEDQNLKSGSKAATTKSGGASKASKSSGASKASKSGSASKASGKPKEEPLISLKSPKAASTSAAKTKAGKSKVNQSGSKSKSPAPSKAEESGDEDPEHSADDAAEHSDGPDTPEAPTKAQPAGSAKGRGSKAKRGRKRKR